MSARHRVLFDLSTLADGFTDVAQATWLLYRLLSRTPELDVTGLIAAPHGGLAHHAFARPAERDNQASFLERLAEPQPQFSGTRWQRLRQRIAWHYRLLFAPAAASQPLRDDLDWHVRLRALLERTLAPADVEHVRLGKFLLTTFNRRGMSLRLRGGLPGQRLDTRGFDFALFQNATVARVARTTRKILCLHDVPLERPDCVASGLVLRRHQAELRGAVASEACFVTRTAAARGELIDALGVPAKRAFVIPHPLNGFFSSDPRRERLPRLLAERRTPAGGAATANDGYFLAVAPLEPRRNHAALLQAFYRLNAHRGQRLKLILAADGGWKSAALAPLLAALARQEQVVVLEGVTPVERRLLYSHALAVVDVAYHEVATRAPLEAMQCGSPLVLSATPGHREIAGGAACYCDPYDVDSITAALARCADATPRQREEMIERGRQHLESFRSEKLRHRWLDLLDALKGLSAELVPADPSRRAG